MLLFICMWSQEGSASLSVLSIKLLPVLPFYPSECLALIIFHQDLHCFPSRPSARSSVLSLLNQAIYLRQRCRALCPYGLPLPLGIVPVPLPLELRTGALFSQNDTHYLGTGGMVAKPGCLGLLLLAWNLYPADKLDWWQSAQFCQPALSGTELPLFDCHG